MQSVLEGKKAYWAQLFIFPKKLIKEIEGVCRRFMWSRAAATSNRAPVAWEDVCLPKRFGGLNLKNFSIWNRATVMKQLWHITQGKERLWIQWIDAYYIKGRCVFQCSIPAGASWMTKNFFENGRCIQSWGGWDSVIRGMKFSIHHAYTRLLGERVKTGWKDLVCKNRVAMKCVFMVWMLAKLRLSTMDRLLKWGL